MGIKHRNENVDIIFTPEIDEIGADYDNFTKDSSEMMESDYEDDDGGLYFTPEIDASGSEYDNFTKDSGNSETMGLDYGSQDTNARKDVNHKFKPIIIEPDDED